MNSVSHLKTSACLSCLYDNLFLTLRSFFTIILMYFLIYCFCGKAISRLPTSMFNRLFKSLNTNVFWQITMAVVELPEIHMRMKLQGLSLVLQSRTQVTCSFLPLPCLPSSPFLPSFLDSSHSILFWWTIF